MTHELYWGDLHSHCSISYGEGTVEQALARARGQLDFCSITGHAFWPDMPTDRERYGEIIDYHNQGFATLASNWPALLQKLEAGHDDGAFVALPSYEWHSLQYGDHNVYAPGPNLELADAPDLPQLRRQAESAGAILVPHHIGYAAGYRGIDWSHFDASRSPVVEIYSMHGCAESDEAPYPMLHDMGPRDSNSTAAAGWKAGHRFGVIASSDHHGGYPGSHGDGRAAVWAKSLTRESIWEAIMARRVYAVTGDKIWLDFRVDDAWMGEEITAGEQRKLSIRVVGSAAISHIELLKNEKIRERLSLLQGPEISPSEHYRLRVTWGWGRKDLPATWHAQLHVDDGQIEEVETCFSGQAIVAPKGVAGHEQSSDQPDLPHALLEHDEHSVTWRSITTGNRSTRHPNTQALSLLLEANEKTRIRVEVNGHKIEYAFPELISAARSTYLRGWLSNAIQVGPADPVETCQMGTTLDDKVGQDCDCYRIRVAQKNGQWAWSSPIWVNR